MNHTLTVTPGIDLSRDLRGSGSIGFRTWVRQVVTSMPQKDWRNLGPGPTYVSINNAIEYGVDLKLSDPRRPNALPILLTTSRLSGQVTIH